MLNLVLLPGRVQDLGEGGSQSSTGVKILPPKYPKNVTADYLNPRAKTLGTCPFLTKLI